VREAIRVRNYSRRTERAYVGWIRRFILFHDKRHPDSMGAAEVAGFLGSLATAGRVSASTQNQAFSALLFLYREVLRRDLSGLEHVPRAKLPARLPVVLTRVEVAAVLEHMRGATGLMARLLYGSGLRVLECARLRVKDVDLERCEIVVRDGKGQKDRVTILPAALLEAMRRQRADVLRRHEQDLRHGFGSVSLPFASNASIRAPPGSRAGSGSSRPAGCTWMRAPAGSSGTTFTKRFSSGRSGTLWLSRESPRPRAATRSGIRSPRISSRPATTSGPSRSCWATATSPRP
jgi:integrase